MVKAGKITTDAGGGAFYFSSPAIQFMTTVIGGEPDEDRPKGLRSCRFLLPGPLEPEDEDISRSSAPGVEELRAVARDLRILDVEVEAREVGDLFRRRGSPILSRA